jgi:hypothetical protein
MLFSPREYLDGSGPSNFQVRSLEDAVIQQPPIPTPPSPPEIYVPGPQGPQGQQGPLIRIGAGGPNAIYEAYRHQRDELKDQLDRLEDQREELTEQLQAPGIPGVDAKGIEQRIAALDLRIASIDKQIAEADAAVARAAAIPGAIVPDPPEPPRQGPPEEFFVLAGIFMFIVVLPLTIAYARRIWRRGAAVVTSLPQDIYDRFTRVEQSLDSIAVEVERIGEGQRFLTRLHAEQRGLGSGPAERVESASREKEPHRRGTL